MEWILLSKISPRKDLHYYFLFLIIVQLPLTIVCLFVCLFGVYRSLENFHSYVILVKIFEVQKF